MKGTIFLIFGGIILILVGIIISTAFNASTSIFNREFLGGLFIGVAMGLFSTSFVSWRGAVKI